ncbi:MAG: geranylgeranylglycerol-phosphate geranylgeranyltransferase [Lentimicrobiaceae bacterium]|jgi:4-hydroxybenzoate polyprenyltransferase
MRTIFTMLRVPNLLIIALTFLLLRYFVFIPVYGFYSIVAGMGSLLYLLMITSTILIAVAGYISNDYFDVITDRVNKPDGQYIGIHITAGTALSTSILFSFLALVLGIWLTLLMQSWLPAILLFIALTVAWWYALKLKKSLLWGNIAVAGMSAGTIAMAWLIEYQYSRVSDEPFRIITYIIVAISIVAFLLSLLREIVKDVEDIEGDRLINCRSLPIIKGIPFTKMLLLIFTLTTLLFLIIAQIYLMQFSRIFAALWLLICVEIPLIYFIKSLKTAQVKADYHKLSTMLKWIMLGGIGSIIAGQF